MFPSVSSHEPSYQEKLPAGFSKPLPFLIPDLPHLFTLALTHVQEKRDLGLAKYVSDANEVCKEIRKKDAVEYIGSRCVTYSPTTFFHFVLDIMFIEKKKDQIIEYYQLFSCLFIERIVFYCLSGLSFFSVFIIILQCLTFIFFFSVFHSKGGTVCRSC